MRNRGRNRGTPYLFRLSLSWFPTWFPGCQDAVEGGFESGEKGLVSQGASGSFVALELWLEIVGGGLPEESPPVFHHGQKRSDLDQPVIEPGQVSGGAAPGIVLGTSDQAGPNGIPFDVARGRKEIVIIENERGETPLPQVPAPLLAEVDASRVASMGLANGPAQSILRGRNGDEVDVIGHEAVGPDLNPAFAAPLGHQLQIGDVVLLAEKRLLPTVPPLRDVMRITRYNHSCNPRHDDSIKER